MTRSLEDPAEASYIRESQLATPHRILNRDRRTLEAIFRHPVSSNIAWSDALHLTERLGTARQEHNGRLLVEIGEQRHVFHQHHAKALTPEEVGSCAGFWRVRA